MPSRRIFAKVDFLFISSSFPSRDDANVLVPLRVNNCQHIAGRHAKQNDSLLSIVLARIDPLDRERVLKSRGSLRKAHTVLVKIRGFLKTSHRLGLSKNADLDVVKRQTAGCNR